MICSKSKGQIEDSQERQRYALKRRMEDSRSKTESMCVNGREEGGMVQ